MLAYRAAICSYIKLLHTRMFNWYMLAARVLSCCALVCNKWGSYEQNIDGGGCDESFFLVSRISQSSVKNDYSFLNNNNVSVYWRNPTDSEARLTEFIVTTEIIVTTSSYFLLSAISHKWFLSVKFKPFSFSTHLFHKCFILIKFKSRSFSFLSS